MTASGSLLKWTNVLTVVTFLIQVSYWSWRKQSQLGDVWRFFSTGVWKGKSKVLWASDSCSRSLALMSVCCLVSLGRVKPRLKPGSDWWSPRPQQCGSVFAPFNETGLTTVSVPMPLLLPTLRLVVSAKTAERTHSISSCLFPRLLGISGLVTMHSKSSPPFC